MTFEIDISAPPDCEVDLQKLEAAVRLGLQVEEVSSAVLSISIVDNSTIHRINREHLAHDYPTDVISFQLDWTCDEADLNDRLRLASGRSTNAAIEGEIVASVEYAREMAPRCGWSTEDELTLYVVHGMLHICGYDDLSVSEKKLMRAREREILKQLGKEPTYLPEDGALLISPTSPEERQPTSSEMSEEGPQ